jgi:hypothetical protein
MTNAARLAVFIMKTSLLHSAGVVIVALSLSGYATATPIVSEWRNPANNLP